MKNLKHWLLAAATLATLGAHAADGFDAGDWKHRQKMLIDSSAEGVELKQGATQVPLALRLHTGNFAFAEARPDGSDLRVTAADGKTPLHFHLEKFDAANELAVLWVQLPKLAPATRGEAFELLWGNDKAGPAADARSTYDAAQTLVLHFSEDGAPRDATGNANHPRDVYGIAAPAVAGPLGSAASFDGSRTLSIPASPSLKTIAANGFSFSAWIKPADVQSGDLVQQGEGGNRLGVSLQAGKLVATVNGKSISSQAKLLPGVWQHVAATLLGARLTLYVNGAESGSGDVATGDIDGEVRIGAGYRGDLDEVTLAASARSADYIKALYGSQQPDSPMLTEANDEEGGESASYLGILLGAVTIDGWVVIGILMLMAVVSFAVMIGKTRFLAITKRANRIFLERFRNESDALLDPDTVPAKAIATASEVAASPIYRIYAIGIAEMQQRFAARGRDKGLSDASLNIIRASIDAAMVRESQRLNSQMVLLTIAISGGPFLGLLGTVVGVMITFAAIAAAGDVNVNSIAPGIAAALVATVAGLAVAIPALFGYNWLAIQIKNVSADTQVFADEFLTRAAELHSR
jgi:biopolymer transport protein ExbB